MVITRLSTAPEYPGWSLAERFRSVRTAVIAPPSRLPRARRVLVVGARRDDLESACGGSLARFVDVGHQVKALVMSHGDSAGDDADETDVTAEAEHLDLAGISVQNFTDTAMASEIEEMARVVEVAVDLFEPDIVLTHSAHDQHEDHHAVHLATLRGARSSSTIMCYDSPSATSEFSPSYFVDVSDYVEAKASAAGRREDRSGNLFIARRFLRKATGFTDTRSKEAHAEGFEIVRALSSDLGDL